MITVVKHEFIERISEILDMVVENGETIEITDHGKVIAHVVSANEPKQAGERDLKTFWANIDQLAAKISAYLPEKVDAVEIVREGRRELQVSELKQTRKQEIKAFWEGMDRLATEIGAHWKDDMSAVDAVRDVRRDL